MFLSFAQVFVPINALHMDPKPDDKDHNIDDRCDDQDYVIAHIQSLKDEMCFLHALAQVPAKHAYLDAQSCYDPRLYQAAHQLGRDL